MGMLFVNMGEGDEKEKKSLLLGAHRDGSISLLKATGSLNKLQFVRKKFGQRKLFCRV